MGDLPVRQIEFHWMVKPPETVKVNHTLTIVGRVPAIVDIQVIEAILLEDSGEHGARFEGQAAYTSPGFNDDGIQCTYVWFFIKLEKRGRNRIKFRISWKKNRELFGTVETFEVRVGDSYDSPFYSKSLSNKY
ncbi:hypothetical protein RRF57_004731 [Xylaria bambusicola]|uniref:Uncharacterized protein n=1 Tax=Xylaria bambusicola TaxID=326684 RepID=A0AAN7Z8V3_9PEZI